MNFFYNKKSKQNVIAWKIRKIAIKSALQKNDGVKEGLPFLYYVSGGIKACVFLNVDIHATVIAYVSCGNR